MGMRKSKKVMMFTLLVTMTICVVACGNKEQQDETEMPQVETEITEVNNVPETEDTETTQEEEVDFGDDLDAFQGEWKQIDNKYGSVVISGETVNFVSDMDISGKEYVDVNTFYFGYEENGELVVKNQHGQTRYNISIGDDEILSISSTTGDDEPRCYEKASDDTSVPDSKEAPKIGMSAEEVYNSTWGYPKKVNKTETTSGTDEQWVYDYGYIYVRDGYVYSIQEQ